ALPSGEDVITPAPCGSALCAALSPGGAVGSVTGQQWSVLVRASLSWRFAAPRQPPLRSPAYTPTLSSLWVVPITLTYDQTAGWRVAPPPTQGGGGTGPGQGP